MKKGKMVGAIALTAALAMGTMPAFAASVSTDADQNEFSDNGSTTIQAQVKDINPQVTATVPLSVTVVFGSQGGSDITGPTSGAYVIKNKGTGNIALTNAELTDVNSVFTTTKMCTFGTNKYKSWDGDNAEWVDTTTGQNLLFTFGAGSVRTFLTSDHSASAAVDQTRDTRYIDTTDFATNGLTCAWPTDGITINSGDSLPIELGGVAYFNSKIDNWQTTNTVCKIKYTIAAASASTGA